MVNEIAKGDTVIANVLGTFKAGIATEEST